MSKEREELEAQKTQWDKEAKELEQYIYDNFYEDKDNLSSYNYSEYMTYLLNNHQDEYQQVIDQNVNLADLAELQQERAYYDGFDVVSVNKVFNQKIINAAKEDLDHRLSLIKPSDYQESEQDIINNIADNQRGLKIEMGE
jgi:hypothetical protein